MLQKEFTKYQKLDAKDLTKCSNEAWQLTLPINNYVGRYHSEEYNNFTVKTSGNKFEVTIGNLHSTAKPFPYKNAMHVELISGAGQLILFEIKDEQVVNLLYGSVKFKKIEL